MGRASAAAEKPPVGERRRLETDEERDISRSLSYERLLLDQGVRRKGELLVHVVPKPAGAVVRGGRRYARYYDEERPVAMSLAEAQAKAWDYYHPEHGWVWGGVKRAQEHQDNLGTGAVGQHQVRLVPIDEPDEELAEDAAGDFDGEDSELEPAGAGVGL